jgi:tetratricopeptide (TPR) repeat protein
MNRIDGQQVLGACPSREELRAFSLGQLPKPVLERVAAHIEVPCPKCVTTLDQLEDRADPLFADLLEPLPLSAAEAAEACRCVLEHVLGPDVSTADWVPPWSPSTATALDNEPPDLSSPEALMAPMDQPDGWPKMGGMGAVWLVRDLQFQRPLALKVMKAERANADRVCRFLNEARITARLAHPSIVPVHAMGWLADGRPYYTMKLVEGHTLADLLESGSDVTSQRTFLLQVFARVCQALAFAHNKGVIHRDLKPIHVMVGEHGEVHIIDWGLAKVLGQSDVLMPAESPNWPSPISSVDGHAMGTWPYMPPEQANGRIEEMDRRSDVFGLGGILCAILTGQAPYVGPDVMRQARDAELAGAYARLKACGADAGLVALARDCLSAKPSDRPEDASVVEKRLTDYLASVEERLRKAKLARQRLRWLSAGLVSTLLALTVASLFAWQAAEAKVKIVEAERDLLAAKRQHAIDSALTAAMAGDLEGAERAIAEAEKADASVGQVEMLRGQIALHRGQSGKAREHLEKAVRLLPKSVAAWGMLAAAYADDGHWERYDKAVREMEQLTPSTPEDFLFKGYAVAYLEPERGLQTIKQAFDRRPMMGIALLLRAEVRAMLAQDTDKLDEAEGAAQDANYARELLHNNPTALWVSLEAHLAKAGVHEHRDEQKQRQAELDLAGKDADALKRFPKLPEAVVYRWTYFREVDREEEVLDELRRTSKDTDHVSANFCCALALYRRGDIKEALRVLENRPKTYNDRLLPFVLAEIDYPNKQHDWPARAVNASKDYAERTQDGAAVMDTYNVLRLLGKKKEAVEASKALLKRPELFYTLRREPILRCLSYNAGELSEDELLQKAEGSQWDKCLAHYNIAMTKLAEGDRDGAKEHFDKAVKTRAAGWGEYDLSWVFRDRLQDPTWPPWIPQGRPK